MATPPTDQFQSWYPQFRPQLQATLVQHCSAQYHAYVTGNFTAAEALATADGEYPQFIKDTVRLVDPVMNCLLRYMSDTSKANMASAGVLLGLMPTMFATIGSTIAETAMISLVAERPLLALLLAAGSPAVAPLRPFEYPEPNKLMKPQYQGAAGYEFPRYKRKGRIAVVALEYAFAAVAVANTATVSYDLGVKAIFSHWAETTLDPLLWAFLTVPIHILGCVSFWLLIKTRRPEIADQGVSNRTRRRMQVWLKNEFTPSANHVPPSVTRTKSTAQFLLLSWALQLSIVVYLFYGTLAFSSILFVGATDAPSIAARYLASVVVCRAIVSYEIAGLRQAYALHHDNVAPPVVISDEVQSREAIRK